MPVFLRWLLRLAPINPITVRLVQGGSRRTRHLYIRSAYLGVLIVVLVYMLLIQITSALDYRALASVAAGSFQIVAYLQIALICLLAPVFMAGAIAQEANPRTWDILLTTPMSATQIVLGNLFGRLFFILALLVSSLPLFALTQLFGGVPGRSIFASYAIAACAALLVGSMAIALSVSRLVGKRAVFAFYVAVVSYLALTWAADRVIATPGMVSWMTAINPFLALQALLDPSGYTRYPDGSQPGLARWFLEHPVTTWCLLSGLISVALMGVSTLTVRIGGLVGVTGEGGGVPWYRKMFGLGNKGAEHRAPRAVWTNPIAWREAAARNATLGRMAARWSFIGFGGLFGVLLVVFYHFGGMSLATFRTVVLYTVLGELAVVCLVALNMSATAVAREREDGTLDLLLTTPITPAAYLGGKVRGMVAYLLPLLAVPVGTLAIAGLYVGAGLAGVVAPAGGVTVPFALPTAMGQAPVTVAVPAVLPEAGLLLAVVAVPFVAFCCMIGLRWSLKSKGTISSVVATVGIVGVVALVTGLCAYTSGSGLSVIGPAVTPLSPGVLVYAGVFAEGGVYETMKDTGVLTTARVGLAIGAVLAAGIYILVVAGLRADMVHSFDMTVRRLAGTA
jgi:ABC-type transport system involved in multi-copper enzyme maturation permease subunit